MKNLTLFIALLILFTNCSDNAKNEKTISISGAFALYPMVVKWAEEYQKLHPDIRIDISAGGAGKGMTDALTGMVDLGMVSRAVTKEETDKGAWFIAVTKDAVLPTINSENPVLKNILVKGLTKEDFTKIFIRSDITDWSRITNGNTKEKINVYTRSDACGAGEIWAKYLGKKQEDIRGIGVYGDPGMADAIKNDVNGIGYNNVIYVYDINTLKKNSGMEVLPIDLNENGKIDAEENFYGTLPEISAAIKEGKYPSPPCRDLYLVSKGKPTKMAVTDFLKWILTDGQKFVSQGGYVELSKEKIEEENKKIKN
ncbi:MAG: extracellular solute-binding protein [Bacteroidia bacterium]|nr:extracellular solute-binding protein [Bacteroidia bacterium]